MRIRRLLAGFAAAAVAGSTFICAGAEAADDVTVYGTAGISFQVQGSWEHRDAVGQELLDESGKIPFDATCYDVNITGNGTYEASLVGWWCEFDGVEMGWISLDTTIPCEKSTDEEGNEIYIFTDYPDAKITLDTLIQDGEEFDLTEAGIGAEDGGNEFHGASYKFVNGWSNPTIDVRDQDLNTWLTTEPLVVKFTVSGLPTDKVEGYADEVIEFISGNGAPSDEPEASEPDSSVEESTAGDTAEEASSAAPAESTVSTADSSETESSNTTLFIIIGAAAAVVVVIIIVVIVKKK